MVAEETDGGNNQIEGSQNNLSGEDTSIPQQDSFDEIIISVNGFDQDFINDLFFFGRKYFIKHIDQQLSIIKNEHGINRNYQKIEKGFRKGI